MNSGSALQGVNGALIKSKWVIFGITIIAITSYPLYVGVSLLFDLLAGDGQVFYLLSGFILGENNRLDLIQDWLLSFFIMIVALSSLAMVFHAIQVRLGTNGVLVALAIIELACIAGCYKLAGLDFWTSMQVAVYGLMTMLLLIVVLSIYRQNSRDS